MNVEKPFFSKNSGELVTTITCLMPRSSARRWHLAFLLGLVLVLPIGLTLFTLQHLIFWMPLLRKFCERLSVNNVHELERIAQTTKPDPKYGEGLADALSIDAFPL